MNKNLLAQVTLLFLSSHLYSQKVPIRFEHLTIGQGLANTVSYAIQDSRGYMWFATRDGLNKFDGYTINAYRHDPSDSNSISWNVVNSIYEDKSGALWIRGRPRLGGNELNRFDRTTEKFTRCLPNVSVTDLHEDDSGQLWFATLGRGLNKYHRSSGIFTQYRLSSDSLYAICEDTNETLWVATARGVDRFDKANGTFVHYDHGSENRVNTIHRDKVGILWVGTDEGLYKFNKVTGEFSNYLVDKSVRGSNRRNDILVIHEDSRGMLWVGTRDGIVRFERSTATYTSYPHSSSPTRRPDYEEVKSIIEDRTGTLWVGTLAGVGRYDRAKDGFTFYFNDPKDSQSLKSNQVLAIYEDKPGILWFGTGAGVDKVDRGVKPFIHYTQEPSSPRGLGDKIITGLVEDKSGTLWVATLNAGLYRLNKDTETFTQYKHNPGDPKTLSSNHIWSLLEDKMGTLWVGTVMDGLDRLDPDERIGTATGKERFKHYTHDPMNRNSLGTNFIFSLFEDRSGKLWIGTRSSVTSEVSVTGVGLDQYDRNTGKFTHYEEDPRDPNTLSGDWVRAIIEDHLGNLWVGTSWYGLNELDRTRSKFTRYKHDPQNRNSLSSNMIYSIYEDSKNTLWISTAEGLNRFDRSTAAFKRITTKEGLSSDQIFGILEDNSGCLWLNTQTGISKFNPQTGTIRNYDASDGVNIDAGWRHAGHRNEKGEMYFGGENGFVRFHPDRIKDNPYIPPIAITAFKKFDEVVALDTAIAEKKAIELPYKDNVFSFEFAALNYTNPEKNQYAYRLEGFDKDWVYCGTRRYATYTNLDAGRYIFRVKGSNNDGVWNEEGASISIIVLPPWWQTWWFRFAAVLTIIGALAAAYRYRVAKLLQMERLRLRIASDLHDDIGSSLSSIALINEMIRKKENIGDQERQQLLRASQSARTTADALKDIVWVINPEHEKIGDLTLRLKDDASRILVGIAHAFQSNAGEETTKLGMEFRRNVILIHKEALNNIVRHARASRVDISLSIQNGTFHLSIADNGQGFDESSVRLGDGLKNLRRRAKEIRGNITITSVPSVGTKILLETKLP